MFASIAIKGLGAKDEDHYFSIARTDIRLPSGSGKTTLLRAIVLLLTGREPTGGHLVREATRGVIVQDSGRTTRYTAWIEGRTHGGSILRRTWDESGMSRVLVRNGESVDVGTEERWQSAIGRYLLPASRYVVAPLAWTVLESDQGGRGLRDHLISLAWPGGTSEVRRDIVRQSPHWQAGDPVDEKPATEARRKAGAALDQSRGALVEAERHLAQVSQSRPVAADDLSRAQRILSDAARVEAHREAVRRVEAVERWDAARSEVGDEPADVPALAVDESRATVEREERRYRDLVAILSGAEALVSDIERRVSALSEPLTSTCPTCGQSIPDADAADVARVAALADAAALAESARESRRQASEDVDAAEARLSGARTALAGLVHARELRAEWTMRLARLGVRPPDAERPAPLDCAVPTATDIESARSIIDRAGATAHDAGAIEAARRRVDELLADVEIHEVERARLDGLVAAIRGAPAAILPRACEALAATGLLGEVAVIPSDDGARVTWRGRPWYVASGGEKLLIDLHLRLAFRALGGVRQLPIIIDNAQDYEPGDGQQWPDAVPSIWLYTEGA